MDELTGTNINLGTSFIDEFSPTGLLLAIVLVASGFLLRFLISKLADSENYKTNTNLQLLRFTINPISIFLTTFIGFQLIGVSTSVVTSLYSSTLVAIGFGMRTILGNFTDGLLVLSGRILNVDDVITFGNVQGRVEKVSIMTTILRDELGRKAYIPNSLIRENVLINYGTDDPDRIEIVVPVPGGVDIFKVREMLFEVANDFPHKAPNTIATVTPKQFHSDAFEFYVMVYVQDVLKEIKYKGDLLWRIATRANELNLSLGYSGNVTMQHDFEGHKNIIHVKSLPDDTST